METGAQVHELPTHTSAAEGNQHETDEHEEDGSQPGEGNVRKRRTMKEILEEGFIADEKARLAQQKKWLAQLLTIFNLLDVCCGTHMIFAYSEMMQHGATGRPTVHPTKHAKLALQEGYSNLTFYFKRTIELSRHRRTAGLPDAEFSELKSPEQCSLLAALHNSAIQNRKNRFPFKAADDRKVPEDLKAQYTWYPDVPYRPASELTAAERVTLFEACVLSLKAPESLTCLRGLKVDHQQAASCIRAVCKRARDQGAEDSTDVSQDQGTVDEAGCCKIWGKATTESILKCLEQVCNPPTDIIKRKGVVKRGGILVDLAVFYNAVMEHGGYDKVIMGPECESLKKKAADSIGAGGLSGRAIKEIYNRYLLSITTEAAKAGTLTQQVISEQPEDGFETVEAGGNTNASQMPAMCNTDSMPTTSVAPAIASSERPGQADLSLSTGGNADGAQMPVVAANSVELANASSSPGGPSNDNPRQTAGIGPLPLSPASTDLASLGAEMSAEGAMNVVSTLITHFGITSSPPSPPLHSQSQPAVTQPSINANQPDLGPYLNGLPPMPPPRPLNPAPPIFATERNGKRRRMQSSGSNAAAYKILDPYALPEDDDHHDD